jgi:hypothetical protein
MNKTTMLGVGVVGIGLAAAYMKMKGGGIPSDVAAIASHLNVYDYNAVAWMEPKALGTYVESSGAIVGIYAFNWTAPAGGADKSQDNPQAIVCVKLLRSTGEIGFEAAKLTGGQAVNIYYDNVLKATLTSGSVLFA